MAGGVDEDVAAVLGVGSEAGGKPGFCDDELFDEQGEKDHDDNGGACAFGAFAGEDSLVLVGVAHDKQEDGQEEIDIVGGLKDSEELHVVWAIRHCGECGGHAAESAGPRQQDREGNQQSGGDDYSGDDVGEGETHQACEHCIGDYEDGGDDCGPVGG